MSSLAEKKRAQQLRRQKAARATNTEGRPGRSIIVYGPSGVGKSSFAGHFPKCRFIVDPQEMGIETLIEFKQVPKCQYDVMEDWTQIVGTMEKPDGFLSEIPGTCQTLVIDSTTGFEKLCFRRHCDEYFGGDWSVNGFYSYGQGPKNAAKTDWPMFLDQLDAVRQTGIDIIVIAHSDIRTYNNPEGPDFDQFMPKMDKEIWSITHRWAQCVLFYNFNAVVKAKEGKAKGKADLEASEGRFLHTSFTPAYTAKNWYGLDPVINGGENGRTAYQAFRKAMMVAKASGGIKNVD